MTAINFNESWGKIFSKLFEIALNAVIQSWFFQVGWSVVAEKIFSLPHIGFFDAMWILIMTSILGKAFFCDAKVTTKEST